MRSLESCSQFKPDEGVGKLEKISPESKGIRKEAVERNTKAMGDITDIPDKYEKTDKQDVTEEKRMHPPVEIDFKVNPEHDKAEMERQVGNQEKGLNKLTIAEYLANRERYESEGRAPEGQSAQREAREIAKAERVEANRDAGMSRAEAEAEAEKWIKSQAALHDPDQIAGGYADKVTGMGDAAINSSIGSQWRGKINQLDAAVKEYAANLTKEEMAQTYLNVSLKVVAVS